MINQQVIDKLKTACKQDASVNAVFHLFALRERTRSTLTVSALSQKMREEGFNYSAEQYRQVLQLLIECKLGESMPSRTGLIKGLKNIKVNLPELGKAVCGAKAQTVRGYNALPIQETYTGPKLPKASISVSLSVANRPPVVLQFPQGVDSSMLSLLIDKLQAG